MENEEVKNFIEQKWTFRGTIYDEKEIPDNPQSGDVYCIKGNWYSKKLNRELKNYDEIHYTLTSKGVVPYVIEYEELFKAHEHFSVYDYARIEIAKEKNAMCFMGDVAKDGDFHKEILKGYMYKIIGDTTPDEEEKAKGLIIGKPKPWNSHVIGKVVYDGDIYCYVGGDEKWVLVTSDIKENENENYE